MSYLLANELRKLMVGESIPREARNEIRAIVRKYSVIKHINNIRSMYIGNNNFMLLISVDVEDFSRGHTIETTTEQIRADISGRYPHAKYIYIDVRPGIAEFMNRPVVIIFYVNLVNCAYKDSLPVSPLKTVSLVIYRNS